MPDVKQEINLLRQRLLDLSLRNRLLSYRPSKQRTLKFVDERPAAIYDTLVLQERVMRFRAYANEGDQAVVPIGIDEIVPENDEVGYNEADEWVPLLENGDIQQSQSSGGFLQTSLEPDVLQKKLFYVASLAHEFFVDQGYSILYLALGFLHWKESDTSEQEHKAPLILVPVELSRTRAGMAFHLSWNSEEIYTNISLQAKLRDQDVELPDFSMPEDGGEIEEYLRSVSAAVRSKGWKVTKETYLDFFSFTKFVMWRDLDPVVWPESTCPHQHPVLQELFGLSVPADIEEIREEEIDSRLSARTLFHIMDADPSQICVLEAIKKGKNLVVEGPPGTGKSQTIANAIAELIAAGKTVLFVSEKMAALEVVKDRLDQAGIGKFCLEIHSRKTKRKAVIEAIRQALATQLSGHRQDPHVYEEHEAVRDYLNRLAEVLRTPYGMIHWTPFQVLSKFENARRHFLHVGRTAPQIRIPNPLNVELTDWRSSQSLLRDMVRLLPTVWPIHSNPWKGTRPGLLIRGDEEPVARLLQHCREVHAKLTVQIADLVRVTGTAQPKTAKAVHKALDAARVVVESEPNSYDVLTSDEWNRPNQDAAHIIAVLTAYQELRQRLDTLVSDKAYDSFDRAFLERLRYFQAKPIARLKPEYWKRRAKVMHHYRSSARRRLRELIEDVEQIVHVSELGEELNQQKSLAIRLFGSIWTGETSDVHRLQRFTDWIVKFRQALITKVLTDESCTLVSKGLDVSQTQSIIDVLTDTLSKFQYAMDQLVLLINLDVHDVWDAEGEHADLEKVGSSLQRWSESLDSILDWSRYVTRRNGTDSANVLAEAMISALEDGRIQAQEDTVPAMEAAFTGALLKEIIRREQVLSSFAGEVHEGRIADFVKLDKDLIKHNRRRLVDLLAMRLPQLPRRLPAESPMAVLKHQMQLQRRHLRIRQLLSRTASVIQQIKPCFMMSPLSIAQYLEPGGLTFDVVLFDEASQVRTEDALGAIIRGRQIVIMGDTEQLPPTSFFDRMTDATDPDDEAVALAPEQNESILKRGKVLLPSKTLAWHYRSRHESLIYVSNREFYGNALQVFPSPHALADHLGLQLIHVPESVYDRGRSKTNPIEADLIVKAVFEHIQQHPEKSLGIGTLNMAQRELILKKVEAARRQHPELEHFFSDEAEEPFFVKNLESIQGDERAVIFISIGYGKDQETMRLPRTFGPLNIAGGENRLNVLMTRARERCVIFTNFLADDLVIEENTPRGVKVLREVLSYARNRELPKTSAPQEESDSGFEDSVHDFLQRNGYQICLQVGCAKYRIDLAVIDPEKPGRYVIGIECDGAPYHSSRVARERDRLRQEVLTNLGWKLYRVWSTDWYRDRERTERRLLRAVQEALLYKETVM